jgi:hypothetical protein
MQPLTPKQEQTMLRWAWTVGARPGKRAKLFLRAERGISEEQIDAWWNNALVAQNQRMYRSLMSRAMI